MLVGSPSTDVNGAVRLSRVWLRTDGKTGRREVLAVKSACQKLPLGVIMLSVDRAGRAYGRPDRDGVSAARGRRRY